MSIINLEHLQNPNMMPRVDSNMHFGGDGLECINDPAHGQMPCMPCGGPTRVVPRPRGLNIPGAQIQVSLGVFVHKKWWFWAIPNQYYVNVAYANHVTGWLHAQPQH